MKNLTPGCRTSPPVITARGGRRLGRCDRAGRAGIERVLRHRVGGARPGQVARVAGTRVDADLRRARRRAGLVGPRGSPAPQRAGSADRKTDAHHSLASAARAGLNAIGGVLGGPLESVASRSMVTFGAAVPALAAVSSEPGSINKSVCRAAARRRRRCRPRRNHRERQGGDLAGLQHPLDWLGCCTRALSSRRERANDRTPWIRW